MADKGLFQRYYVKSLAALGRIFQLGDLYNYYQDEIIKDCTVWEIATLASNTHRAEEKYELRISSDHDPDRITGLSKWENMRLDQHLQISIMAGIIDKFQGASNFASDRSDSSVATQTFVCRAKSREEHLDLQALADEKPLLLDMPDVKGQATHVVVSILYGAEAYCVLTDDQDNNEKSGKEFKEKLARLWESSLTQGRDLLEFKENFDNEEKLMLNSNVKCRLYADLQPEAVRQCSFFEAYQQCLNLIHQVQNVNASKSVPIVVMLCPLEVILSSRKTIEKIYNDADVALVSRCCRICDMLEKILTKADALAATVAEENRHRLRRFEDAVAKYQVILKASLKNSVLKARLTSVDELQSITEIAENHSLFKPSKLKRWLFYEEAELQLTRKLIAADLNEIPVFTGIEQLKSKSSEGKKFVVVLRVPSVNQDSFKALKAMKDYVEANANLVDDPDDEGDFNNDGDTTEEEEEASGIPYHTVKIREQHAREEIRDFLNFVERNKQLVNNEVEFFVEFDCLHRRSVYNTKPQRSRFPLDMFNLNLMHTYDKYGFLFLRCHQLPRLPVPPTDLRIQHPAAGTGPKRADTDSSSFILQWNYKNLENDLFFVVRYRLKGSSDDISWREEKTTVPKEKTIRIVYETGKALEIKVAAITRIGQSEYSDILDTESFILQQESSMESAATVLKQPQRSDDQSPSMVTPSSSDPAFQLESSETEILEQLPMGLKIGYVTFTTAEVVWTPTAISGVFNLRYWPKGEDPSSRKLLVVSSNEIGFRLKDLKVETTYLVNLSVAKQLGETFEFQTLSDNDRVTEMLVSRSEKIETRDGMGIYAVPLTKTTPVGSEIERYYTFGRPEPEEIRWEREISECETILLVGASGSGKTSLANAMINYVFGVDWPDPFRFQLDEAVGHINVYDIHRYEGFSMNCSRLTIIDTPGYGEDANKNQEITKAIRKLFQDNDGEQEVNVVGFVMKSSLQKPTVTEKFIYESMISIFGEDIQENLNYFLTFADNNKEPPLLENFTGTGLPLPKESDGGAARGQTPFLQFNNLAYFSWNKSSPHQRLDDERSECGGKHDLKRITTCNLNHFLWSMTDENIFCIFEESFYGSEPKSISMIQNLLNEKMRLESTIDGLDSYIKFFLLGKIEERLALKRVVPSKQKAETDDGTYLVFQVEETTKKKMGLAFGELMATNCTECKMTCHHPCGCLNGVAQCDVMEHSMPIAYRRCKVCPFKCLWSSHASQPFKWIFGQQTLSTRTGEIKDRGETNEVTAEEVLLFMRKEEFLEEINSEIEYFEKIFLDRLEAIGKYKEQLIRITSKRYIRISPMKYINQLIADEKKEGRSELRIKCLKRIRLLIVIRLSE